MRPNFQFGLKIKVLSVLMGFGFASVVHAHATIFHCSGAIRQWSLTLSLYEDGDFVLQGKKGGKPFQCSLKITEFEYLPESLISSLLFYADLKSCRTGKTAPFSDRELLPRLNVFTNPSSLKHPNATVQWISDLQPNQCEVTTLDLKKMSELHEKWKKGTWPK